MTGGVMSWGKVVRGETALYRHPRALATLITHYPHFRFLSRMFHARDEDEGTREERRDRLPSTHKHCQP